MNALKEYMRKKNYLCIKIIMGVCLLFLAGCSSRGPETEQISEDLTAPASGTDSQEPTPTDFADSMAEKEPAEITVPEDELGDMENTTEEAFHVPTLPDTGGGLMDFVPEGWELWDSAELDFNEDRIPDYVGVLDIVLPYSGAGTDINLTPPRILFAIASEGPGQYRLDFQDINLVRTRDEGGVFGDPYLPLTAEKNSFTLYAYGGSAWKWSEKNTYTYQDGIWRKTMSESTYGYGEFVTSYEKNDWESGIGIRKERADDFSYMEKYWDSENPRDEDRFDVEYEVALDEPPTLYQSGMRWYLAPERVTDWSVDSIEFSEDVKLSEDRVKPPDKSYKTNYCDEDCVLYTFQDEYSSLYYLAMYQFQNRKLFILTESDTAIETAKIYKKKIYYSSGIMEETSYKRSQDKQTQVATETNTIGLSLNRMNPDGTGKEIIFEYRYPETEQEIPENRLPYLTLLFEISGDEIIARVYIGNEPHPVYRMRIDGKELRQIRQIPSEILQ